MRNKGRVGKITKEQRKTFGDDYYIHYLGYGDDFVDVYICQNLIKF